MMICLPDMRMNNLEVISAASSSIIYRHYRLFRPRMIGEY